MVATATLKAPRSTVRHDITYFTALIDDPVEEVGLLFVSDVNYNHRFKKHVEARTPEFPVVITSDAVRLTEPQPLRTLINCVTALLAPKPDYLSITRAVARSLS